MEKLEKLINDYINNKLLNVDSLPTELNGGGVYR